MVTYIGWSAPRHTFDGSWCQQETATMNEQSAHPSLVHLRRLTPLIYYQVLLQSFYSKLLMLQKIIMIPLQHPDAEEMS